jgi:hypothetical protein
MQVLSRAHNVFQNGLFQPHPKAGEPRAIIHQLIRAAMPFDMTDEVIELAIDVAPHDLSDEVLLDLFGSVELPAPITWLEFNDRGDDGSVVPVGLLLVKTDNNTVLHITHFPIILGRLTEPHFSTRVHLTTRRITLHNVDHVCEIEKSNIMRGGVSEAEAAGRVEWIVDNMADIVLGATKIAYHALQLLNAKNAPVHSEPVEMLSRQQRRAMERRAPGSSKVSRITRIVLNQQGRAQLSAIRSEDGYEARRRAHWVRGHLMRTANKGLVWRRCHVRGVGEPVMRDRVVIGPACE